MLTLILVPSYSICDIILLELKNQLCHTAPLEFLYPHLGYLSFWLLLLFEDFFIFGTDWFAMLPARLKLICNI